MFVPATVIKKKREGGALSPQEISTFIRGYTAGAIPDYQMSALLMAIYFKGMTKEETLTLTQEMLHSGIVLDLSTLKKFKVDKHSTGGVGDKTSLILGPIVAAAGFAVPMISGRGLGHTGGTLDKLESIPGFNTQLDLDQFRKALAAHSICFIGQTKEICPADKKIYALRDVTATVESLPLICASIMSKKLAEGIDALVLDVKFGSGAFMKDYDKSRELALRLMEIARGAGKKVATFMTSMEQPLGSYAGNSLEVEECVRIMRGEPVLDARGVDRSQETRELSLRLSASMMFLSGTYPDLETCYREAVQILDSGRAYQKFEELCHLHSGRLSELPAPKNRVEVLADCEGFVSGFETETIGWIGVKIKAGRAQTTDLIEPTAGIEFHAKIGDFVRPGEPLFTLYGNDSSLLLNVQAELLSCVSYSQNKVTAPTLIREYLS
jgi:pyrimidine-nucleoside phosphorylase